MRRNARRMKAVVLVPSLDEQREAGGYFRDTLVDPAGITVHGAELAVTLNNRLDTPPVGRASNVRLKDGRLVADIELFRPLTGEVRFSVSGLSFEEESSAKGERTISRFDVLDAALHPPAEPD